MTTNVTIRTRYGMVLRSGDLTTIIATAEQTYDWAHKSDAAWPCSGLSGDPVTAEFDSKGDLVGLAVRDYSRDVSADELSAWSTDVLSMARGVMAEANAAMARAER